MVLLAILIMCVSALVLQIITYAREEIGKNSISEQAMIGLIWSSVMSSVEWNKKEELVTEQAIKLLKVTPLLCGSAVPGSTETVTLCASEMFQNQGHCRL